ncbi:MAG: hypothetical protein WC314_15855 [Vulcanimicrobiota bacterium]
MINKTPETHPRPNRAIVAGFCASAASALVLLFSHILARIIHEGTNGSAFGALIDNSLTMQASSNLYLALGLHFFIGIGLGYLYMHLRKYLPEDTLTAGVVFMTPPFLASVLLLYPLTGGGFFGLEYGAGMLPVVGSLVLHAVYGITMVGLYEKVGSLSHGMSQRSGRPLPRTSYWHAATGILYGAFIGMAVAASLWFLVRDSLVVPGLPLEFTLMALVYFFSTAGLLVGFWTGNPMRRKAPTLV